MSWFRRSKKPLPDAEIRASGEDEKDCPCDKSESLSFESLFTNTYSNRSLSAVYSCVELISSSIASIPMRVVEEDEHGHRTIVKHHPLQRIFKSKNVQTMTFFNIMKSVMTDVLLSGNGYILINRNETGLPISLRYIKASAVSVQYDAYHDTLYYIITIADDKGMRYKPQDVIHIVRNTSDGVNGISTTTFAKDAIGLAKSSEVAAKKFFDSNMNVAGLLSCKTMMTEQQRTSIKDAWMSGRGENTLQILPLGVDYVKLGVASKDAQLLESRGYNTQEITRFFTVPLQLIQAGDKMTYTNLEDLNNIFYQYSLLPFIRSIEEEFTRKFFIDSDYIVDMDEDEFLMRVNKNTLSSYLSTLVGGGIMSVNEARVYLGLKEVKDGDQLHIAYSDASKAQIGNDSEPNA